MTSREQAISDARELFKVLDLGWECQDERSALLDQLRERYGGPREPSPSREVAAARMSLDSASQGVEAPGFADGTTATIRNKAGNIEAVACVAVGWRAAWLADVMSLLNGAVERAVADLRARSKEGINRAVQDVAQRSLQPKPEKTK